MLYGIPGPYEPSRKLVFIFDAEKGIKTTVERHFPIAYQSRHLLHLMDNYKKKCQDLRFALKFAMN